MRQQRGYIAGPMRGYPDFNFPAFDRAAQKGKALGYDLINPAQLDRESGIHEEDTAKLEDAVNNDSGLIRSFVDRDVAALLSLRAEHGDFIALLPGWHKSSGATAEFYVARWLKLGVRCAETFHPMEVNIDTKLQQFVRPPLMDNYTDLCKTGTCGI